MQDFGAYRPMPAAAAKDPARELSWRAWLAVVVGGSLGTIAVMGSVGMAFPLAMNARLHLRFGGVYSLVGVSVGMVLFGAAVWHAQASLRALRHGRIVHGRLVGLDKTSGWRWFSGALRARIQLDDREGHELITYVYRQRRGLPELSAPVTVVFEPGRSERAVVAEMMPGRLRLGDIGRWTTTVHRWHDWMRLVYLVILVWGFLAGVLAWLWFV